MTESRICATDRLRQEGRWDEASAFRDEVRKQLRADGKSRAEANDAAWTAMIETYPPLSVPEVETDELDDLPAELVTEVGDLPVCFEDDAKWVYCNLANRNATPDAAPNSGAWALLKWARDHGNQFFQQVLPKATSASQQKEGRAVNGKGEPDHIIGVLENQLEQMRLESAQEIIAYCPGTVRKRVESAVGSWEATRNNGLAAVADQELVAAMCSLVEECISATEEHSQHSRGRPR